MPGVVPFRSILAAVLYASVVICLLVGATACNRDIAPNRPSGTVAASPHTAPARRAVPAAITLTAAIQNVGTATSVFGLRDSAGTPMDTLKVVPYAQGYLGVYHHYTARHFVVRIATSTNLRIWHYWSELDGNVSQPTLAALADGSYVVAVEADNGNRAGPGRRWLRFLYYTNLADLLSGRSSRTFDAPPTLTTAARGAEGTPNIYTVTLSHGIAKSRIVVGFHYLHKGLDREARGVLVNFSSWSTQPDNSLDTALARLGMLGKHGDRDALELGNRTYTLIEAQTGSDNLWRIDLFDSGTGTARPLNITTPGHSRSFANPTVAWIVLPNGHLGLVVTLYVTQTGAGPGEAGELLYYREFSSAG